MYAVLPKYLSAEAVESSYICPVFEAGGKGSDPASHFIRGLVRKGEGKQPKVLTSGTFEQRRNPAGEDLCFAGSWSCQNEQRSLAPLDGLSLNVG
jgi:hypothetical protein